MSVVGVQLRVDVGSVSRLVWSSHKLCHVSLHPQAGRLLLVAAFRSAWQLLNGALHAKALNWQLQLCCAHTIAPLLLLLAAVETLES